MASACPICHSAEEPGCCERTAAARAAFADLQAKRAALLDHLGIEHAQSPRYGGHSVVTEWETVPDLDSLFAFLEATAADLDAQRWAAIGASIALIDR